MLVLVIKTDQAEAQLGIYSDGQEMAMVRWLADRQLAETIHLKLRELLQKAELKLPDVEGIVIYEGPGSFTGLRIGFSVANALAYSLQIKIVAAGGTNWIKQGLENINQQPLGRVVLPNYGRPPRITKPRK